jgi:hypothetical protein
MSYSTPPALNPTTSASIISLRNTIVKNATEIKQRMVAKAIDRSGVTPKINIQAVVQYIEGVIIPTIGKWEGGWSDHPNDSGGPTMRGVILTTLVSTFDDLFVNSGVSEVTSAANKWNNQYPNWSKGPAKQNALGKQLLYELCGSTEVASLFMYKFLCSKSNRYPVAIMTEDPYLGYFLMDMAWGSGPGFFTSNGIDTLAKEYGWNGENFAKFCVNLGDKTPEFAIRCLQKRVDFILKISQPGSKNSVFRKGWMNRTVNNKNSQLAMLVITNEIFNLNTKGLFNFTVGETAHLQRKAQIYKQLEITLP